MAEERVTQVGASTLAVDVATPVPNARVTATWVSAVVLVAEAPAPTGGWARAYLID